MIKVLLIEDDPIQVMILGTKIEMEGMSYFAASNGNDALNLAISKKPDIILSDIILGGENGLDIIGKIKEEKKTKDIPVIVFTNYTDKLAMERAGELGVIEYITKSVVTPKKMVKKIKEYIKKD